MLGDIRRFSCGDHHRHRGTNMEHDMTKKDKEILLKMCELIGEVLGERHGQRPREQKAKLEALKREIQGD